MTDNPDCLRSLSQVKAKFNVVVDPMCADGDFAVLNPSKCGPVHAEQCYAGSSASTTVLSLGLLLTCVLVVAAAFLA